MYLKKVDGPRAVTLPDGTIMSRADLPPARTRRWVASRKAAVVRGVVYGLISQSDVFERYNISEEEFLNGSARCPSMGRPLCGRRRFKNTDNFRL